MKNNSGFTLVELAIVLMIIGLLIGGVLKGQELTWNARNIRIIKIAKSHQAALNAFRDAYSNLPGDMSTATNRLPGCTAANFCSNGNGNNIVGELLRDFLGAGGNGQDQTGTTAPRIETTLFWKHLALANFITEVDPAANPARPAWGVTHPSSPVGGGYQIIATRGLDDSANTSAQMGIHTRMQNNITGYLSRNPGEHPISPIRAFQIDKKMDDGLSNMGHVQSDYNISGCDNDTDGTYMNTTRNNCTMFFKID